MNSLRTFAQERGAFVTSEVNAARAQMSGRALPGGRPDLRVRHVSKRAARHQK